MEFVIILVVLAGYFWMVWCLRKGRISIVTGTDLHRRTVRIQKDENPIGFWIAWVSPFIALTIFLVYFLRTLLP